jgi:hypothetical protein
LFIFAFYQKKIKYFINILIWSISLTAFFLFPSVLEKSLTTNATMTQGYFDYHIHFATLKQLFFDTSWGYGASLWGPIDDMSFKIGFLQWIIPTICLFFSFYKKHKNRFFLLGLYLLAFFFLFLTHNKSTFIWDTFPFMAYFQFPWRFVGPAVFCFSLISASLKPNKIFLLVIIFLTVGLNFSYFHEDIWYSKLTDSQKLTGENFIAQSGAGLKDYYPKFSEDFPQVFAPMPTTYNFIKKSNYFFGSANVDQPNLSLNLPLAYFPKMELRIDNIKSEYRLDPKLGTIIIDLPFGLHYFYIELKDTPIRHLSNLLSLLSLGLFIIKYIREQK